MLNIYTIPVTPFMQNARVLHESHSGAAIIVDPGGDLDQILSVVGQLQPPEISVLLTHAHIDHAGATAACLEVLRREYPSGVRLLAHPEPLLRASVGQQAQLFGLPSHEYRDVPDPDVTLADNDRFLLGDCTAEVYWTPGHAPDHLSVYFPVERVTLHEAGRSAEVAAPVVLAGDALFAGSIGRTDLPGGSLPLLLASIRQKLLVLPEKTVVLSGHGPATTIGEEKRYNPFLQA